MWFALALVLHAGPGVKEPALREQLLQLMQEDQRLRREAAAPVDAGAADFPARFREAASRHARVLRGVLDAHGWPGRSLVGDDGALAAWLLAQHLDDDPPLQRRCLELLERAVAANDADAESLAWLTDRVLVNEGKPQRYGTQGNGAITPADRARVNANRRTLGLPPLR